MSEISRRGLMMVISSPSGAGKTTLARRLLDSDDNLDMSVSVTTRPARPEEAEGKDYFFLDVDAFKKLRDENALLEWAQVFDNFYGTPKKFVEEALEAGRDILFDIDWQGSAQLEKILPDDLVTVFILPPSAATLEQRLTKRGQDPAEVMKRRMAGAGTEIKHWVEYDYIIVNEDIDQSLSEIRAILTAERLRRARRYGLEDFVETLQTDLL